MTVSGFFKKADERVVEVDVMGGHQSLDEVMPDGENRCVDLTIGDTPDLEGELAKKEWRKKAQEILAGLPLRERKIVYLRFWEDKVLEEIGEELKLSRERIRQVLNEVLQALRESPELEDYEDID
jgi:RNA polymerase sigma factor (sigma-70 family)